jgi:hypothetical protein
MFMSFFSISSSASFTTPSTNSDVGQIRTDMSKLKAMHTYDDERTGQIRLVGSNRGRPRSLDAGCCLGLVLFWYWTKRGRNDYSFGVGKSPLENGGYNFETGTTVAVVATLSGLLDGSRFRHRIAREGPRISNASFVCLFVSLSDCPSICTTGHKICHRQNETENLVSYYRMDC